MLADVFSNKSQPFDAGLRIQKYNTLSECESQTECSENFACNNSDYPLFQLYDKIRRSEQKHRVSYHVWLLLGIYNTNGSWAEQIPETNLNQT